MKLIPHTLALAFVAASFASAPAQADGAGDWKGYPGSNCLAHSGSNDVRRSTAGRLANYQDTSTIVYCPVVRDQAAGGDDRIYQARVRIFDNNSHENGWCRLVVRTLSGSLFTWDHASWTGTGSKTLTLGPLDASNWGNYTLYCRLPAADGTKKSFIRNYAVDED